MSIAPHIMDTLTPPADQPVGLGLRTKHYDDILSPDAQNQIGWIEVHPENYFGGGAHRVALLKAREAYPLSLHGVGLSLGSDQPVSTDHLAQLKDLINIYEPFQVSDHASWSMSGNAHLNDLLPLPYTQEVLTRLSDNVQRTQDYLGREILVENPSTYISFTADEMSEYAFMNALSEKTGCYFLLDINNIYVQANNHQFDAIEYLDNINASRVKEIHLAGHIQRDTDTRPILIDTHSRPVGDPVWDLYSYFIAKNGAFHTLIEWDQDIPAFDVLLSEADKAKTILLNPSHDHVPSAAAE